MLEEFKKFAMRGNVVDLAVGIIIGGAFGKIVSSFVADILMPPLGKIMGKVDFTNLFIDLSGTGYTSLAEAKKAGAATINYGLFINSVVSFVIVAFCVFLLVRAMNRMRREEAAPPAEPTTKDCPHCFSSIAIKATRCPQCTAEIK